MYSLTATLSGLYVDYFTLGQGLLKMVPDIHEVTVTDQDAALIEEGMLTMPGHPDVAKGLTMLNDKGFGLVTRTNSPPIRAGKAHWNTPCSGTASNGSSASRRAGPTSRPRTCTTMCRRNWGVAPSAWIMVAAHVWDTVGAQSAGFSSALITRPGNAPLTVPRLPQPNIVVPDLEALGRGLPASETMP
jgi:2-haloacid dehalogenase